jgi:membrane protein DedA with SNARE-associated domain
MSQPVDAVAGWTLEVLLVLGYAGLAGLVALETIFPPIPSELILPLAGFLTGQGRLAFAGAVAAATLGSVVGALSFYAVGRALGEARLRSLVRRYGHGLLLDERDLDRAQGWFVRHGPWAVVVGRLIPGVRSYVSIPAGFARMPLLPFTALTALGSGVWNGLLIGLGWLLGDRWQEVGQYVRPFSSAVTILLVALLAWFVWRRLASRRERSSIPGSHEKSS